MFPGIVCLVVHDGLADSAVPGAGQGNQVCGATVQPVSPDSRHAARLTLGVTQGDQLRQVPEAVIIPAKQHQPVVPAGFGFILQAQFRADHGFDSAVNACAVELDH